MIGSTFMCSRTVSSKTFLSFYLHFFLMAPQDGVVIIHALHRVLHSVLQMVVAVAFLEPLVVMALMSFLRLILIVESLIVKPLA